MTLGIAYWVLMIIALFYGAWSTWPGYRSLFGPHLLVWLLLALLGWKVFPIHG